MSTKKKGGTPDEGVPQLWTYMGRRVDAKGKIYAAFLTNTGKTAYFAKVKAHAIGHRYTVRVVGDGEQQSILTNTIKYHDDKADNARKDEWVAEDEIALQTQARMRLEKKHGDQLLNMTLWQLKRVSQQFNIRERQALISIIITHINPTLF